MVLVSAKDAAWRSWLCATIGRSWELPPLIQTFPSDPTTASTAPSVDIALVADPRSVKAHTQRIDSVIGIMIMP